MPELPEVETVRRGLRPVMEGAVIERMEQRLGVGASRGQHAGLEYLRVEIGPLRLILGTKDNELRWAMLPGEREAEVLTTLFGEEGPASDHRS